MFFDDLTGVLDDAEYNEDAVADQPGELSYSEPRLRWSGALAAGEEVTLTYSTTLQAGGDRNVKNVAFVGDPETPEPPTPECVEGATDVSCVEYDLPALEIEKAADRATLPSEGETVTYTVNVTNPGPGAYTEAAPATASDDLTEVLDDATLDEASLTASVGNVVLSGSEWKWTGALAAGESATINYTVTYTGEGDQQLDNTACVPADQVPAGADPCASVSVPGSKLTQSKESTPSADPLNTGDYVDYTLWFDNAGKAAAEVDSTDFIGYVLDDAVIVDGPAAGVGNLTATLTGEQIRIVGEVPAGERYSITYRAEVKPKAERGDNLMVNHLLPGEVIDPPEPPTPGECVDTTTSTCDPIPSMNYEKSVSSDDDPIGTGSVLTYTVKVTNSGEATGNVAREDVLTDVLDDADLTSAPESDTASVTVSDVTDERFRLGGTLPAGDTAIITYQVTVKDEADRGNSTADNFIVFPGEEPPTVCEDGDADCTTTPLPVIQPSKTVDPASGTSVAAGDVLSYTLTFTNSGEAAGAVAYTDVLANIVDDATLAGDIETSDPALTAVAGSDDTINVSGALAAGQTVTVTYQVTVKADGERGDNNLGNFLVRSGEEPPTVCDSGTKLCTENPVAEIGAWKSVEADRTPVRAGTVLTYTLHFENTGEGDGDVNYVDDLTEVTDDADVTTEPASADGLTAARNGNQIAITGDLAAGETATVTYQVTVKADDERGDDTATNYIVKPNDDGTVPPPPPACQPADDERPDCTTTPIGKVMTVKSVSASETPVQTGTILSYTLTFDNQSKTRAVVDHTDLLADVLDDAEIVEAPVASDAALTVSDIADGRFTVTGELESGQTATVTYQVKVKPETERGDNAAANFLVEDGEEPPAECLPEDPNCTETLLPRIVSGKTSDPASGATVIAGDEVSYTLTFSNTGEATGPLDYTDDLAGVLDDATLTAAPVASLDTIQVTDGSDGAIRVTGDLAAGDTVTVTYTVTVKADDERGDHSLRNAIVKTGTDECIPAEDAECLTEHPIPHIVDSKSVNPASGTPVVAGQELTYTLTFENQGTGTGTVAKVDDLTHVLDDAELVTEPVASSDAFEVSREGNLIGITGELAAGETGTVTYTVKVRASGDRGDDILANFLLKPGTTTPEPVCEDGDEDCTTNPVGDIKPSKTVDPESGTQVKDGAELTYTLTFENTGKGAAAVDYTDHMADILDDATLVGKPVASDDLAVTGPQGNALHITGAVAPGETSTVVYTVKVKAYDEQGSHNLGNFLTVTGEEPPAECVSENPLCTENPIEPPKPGLAITGAGGMTAAAIFGLLILMGGGTALLVASRRKRIEE